MGEKKGFFEDKKKSVIFTLIVMIVGSVFYFMFTGDNTMKTGGTGPDPELFKDIRLKAVYTEEGALKVFALAKNNELARLMAEEGNVLPETDSIVIGYAEGMMMKEEGLFKNVGDRIPNLFGVDITIGGILKSTGTMIDDFHFLSETRFDQVNGEEGRMFVKFTDDGMPKLFYTYYKKDPMPLEFNMKEGDFQNYKMYIITGEDYYPLIVGATEAEMMREEKLFEKPGDIIKGFFGKDVVIVGVIEKTGTALDMTHIISLKEEEFPQKIKP